MNIAISPETKNNFESIYDLDNPAQFLFVFEKVISFYEKKNFTGLSEGSEEMDHRGPPPRGTERHHRRRAKKLVARMAKLGPTFIKLGVST